MTRPYRDTFTVTQQPDGKWIAKMHGCKAFEYFGDTASEALANAGKISDYASDARQKWFAQQAKEE